MNERPEPRLTDRPISPRAPAKPAGGRMPITVVLMLGFGSLVLIAGAVGLWFGGTIEVGAEDDVARLEAEVAAVAISESAGARLRPVHDASLWVAGRISLGQIGRDDVGAIAEALDQVLSKVPAAVAATYAGSDGNYIRVERDAAGVNTTLSSWNEDSPTARSIAVAGALSGPAWIPDVHPNSSSKGRAELLTPVQNGPSLSGVVSVAVNVVDLTLSLGQKVTTAQQSAFLLANGHRLLAHDSLADGVAVPLDEPQDPILRAATSAGALQPPPSGTFGEARVDRPDGRYVAVFRALPGIADQDGVVGIYYRDEDMSGAASATTKLALVLTGLVLLAVLAAVLVGGVIGRPIRAMVVAAEGVGRLDFTGARALPDSRIRELDRAARAFDAMQTGLKWFEDYVPNRLVRRLMAEASRDDGTTELRDVTVMFVQPEVGMAHQDDQTAEVFAQIAQHVEAEDGTVDRYFDKAILAFWGTPKAHDDDAVRACRAALAIVQAARRDAGPLAKRVRVAMHIGAALPVTIGGDKRLNHTVIGGAVNVARNVLAAEDIGAAASANGVILVTQAVVAAIGNAFSAVSTGARLIDEFGANYEVSILSVE